MADYAPSTGDPLGGDPILLSPATYTKVAAVVEYVEQMGRSTLPRPRSRGRNTSVAAGAWGYLHAGDRITGVVAGVLGEGDVTLCSRDEAELTPDGDVVHVFNIGRGVKAGPNGLFLRLAWMDGEWTPVLPNFALGRAHGPISPRTGTTYGEGRVDIYESNSAYGYGYGSEEGPIDTVDVLNASSTTYSGGGGIADGTYCAVAWDVSGVAWASPLECPP